MLKNKGARNLGLACIHHTGYTDVVIALNAVSYTHLTLPTILRV